MAEYRYNSALGEVAPTLIDGPPPVDQTALVATLTLERDTALTLAANRKTVIDGMVADIQAANQADVAEEAADSAGDAARAAALAKGLAAP